MGSDFHSSAIDGRVGECSYQCGLVAALKKNVRIVFIYREDLNWLRRKPEHGGRQAERVAAVSAQPAGKPVGAASNLTIQSDAGNAAKIRGVSRSGFQVSSGGRI